VEIGLTWSPAVSIVAEDLRRAGSLKPARVSPVHSVQFRPLRVPGQPDPLLTRPGSSSRPSSDIPDPVQPILDRFRPLFFWLSSAHFSLGPGLFVPLFCPFYTLYCLCCVFGLSFFFFFFFLISKRNIIKKRKAQSSTQEVYKKGI
jgi:hypothetical protein